MCTLKYFFYDWGGYNKIISQFIHSATEYKFLTIFAKSITQMGNFYLFPIHFTLIVLIFFMMLRVDNKNIVQRKVLYTRCISLLLLNVLIGAIIFKFMKNFFSYPRPYCVLGFNMKEYLLHLFKYSQEACNNSFPSGHSAYICLFIMSFWSILSKNLKMITVLVIILVGISRVILAKHFMADVIYSYLIVLTIINPFNNWLVNKYLPRYQTTINKLLKKIC